MEGLDLESAEINNPYTGGSIYRQIISVEKWPENYNVQDINI